MILFWYYGSFNFGKVIDNQIVMNLEPFKSNDARSSGQRQMFYVKSESYVKNRIQTENDDKIVSNWKWRQKCVAKSENYVKMFIWNLNTFRPPESETLKKNTLVWDWENVIYDFRVLSTLGWSKFELQTPPAGEIRFLDTVLYDSS